MTVLADGEAGGRDGERDGEMSILSGCCYISFPVKSLAIYYGVLLID